MPRDWKDVIRRVAKGISRQRIVLVAAGVTFYALLAIFPALAALVALYGLVADPAAVIEHIEKLSGLLPGGAVDVIRDQIARIAAKPRSTLGLAFAAGLVVSLWSANGGVKALFDALNVVYVEKEKRGFVRVTAVSLAFVVGGILFVLLAVGAVVAVPIALRHLGIPPLGKSLISIGRWPILFAIVALVVALVYRFGPDRTNPRWRWISWGSASAAIAWLAVSALFSWYAANFGNYNETYGSLGAVIGFMTWIWLSAIVILTGAGDRAFSAGAAVITLGPSARLEGAGERLGRSRLARAWRGAGELLSDNPLTRLVTSAALVHAVRRPGRVLCAGLALAAIGWGLDTQTRVETDIAKLVPQSMASLQNLGTLERSTGVGGEIDLMVSGRDVTELVTISGHRKLFQW